MPKAGCYRKGKQFDRCRWQMKGEVFRAEMQSNVSEAKQCDNISNRMVRAKLKEPIKNALLSTDKSTFFECKRSKRKMIHTFTTSNQCATIGTGGDENETF